MGVVVVVVVGCKEGVEEREADGWPALAARGRAASGATSHRTVSFSCSASWPSIETAEKTSNTVPSPEVLLVRRDVHHEPAAVSGTDNAAATKRARASDVRLARRQAMLHLRDADQ